VGWERFDACLRQWFDTHAFQPATSAMILDNLNRNLVRGDAALGQRLMLDQWIYQPGLPANAAQPDPAAFAEVDAAAKRYGELISQPVDYVEPGMPTRVRIATPDAWTGWTTAERMRFMQKLPQELNKEELRVLDENLGLSTTGNNEVLFLWLKLALANRYEPAVPVAERFLASVGRRKFVVPLFETLMGEGPWGKAHAKRIYAGTRLSYHAVTRSSVDKVMGS